MTTTSTDLSLGDFDRLFEAADDIDLVPGLCTAKVERVEDYTGNEKPYMRITYRILSGVNLNKLAFQRLYLTKFSMVHVRKTVHKLAPEAKNVSDFLIKAVRHVGIAVELDIQEEGEYSNAYLIRSIPSTQSVA